MVNVTAQPFRMISLGNPEGMNRELIACFVKLGIGAPWRWSGVCLKGGALHLGLTAM